ncbi:hypothetical protein KY328_05205 [Candidatus Woesearchaeota archaeon]|nr:hypothetical protein [Candidatus Woesearchaeota archaeon]MBW3022295.1 hypothetical protein [Candidatus Woesearchaeota archaeon]
MAKWKYQKPKEKPKEYPYIYLTNDKEEVMVINDWVFEKNAYNDSLFRCHVTEWNGEEVDKIWSVWDFEVKEELRKMLRGKNPNKESVKIKVIKHEEDMEDSFEISEVKG